MFRSALQRCLKAPIAIGMRTTPSACAVKRTVIITHSAPQRLYAATSEQSSTKRSPFEESARFSKDFVEFTCQGQNLKLSNIWLRDNCRCDKCFSSTLQQRKIAIQELDLNVKAVSAQLVDGAVEIHWSDGHQSTYEMAWLMEHSYPGPKARTKRFLWNKAKIQDAPLPVTDYTAYMNEPEALKQHLKNIITYGFAFLTGAPVDYAETVKTAERIGFTMETFYGKSWEFQADMSTEDKSFTNLALGAHTDTTFLPIPAGLQLLHCLEHTGEGGLNLLVDGFYCAELLRTEDKATFDMLKEVRILHEFFERNTKTATECMDTMIKTHPSTDELVWLRFCEFDRAPVSTLPQDQVQKYYEGMTKLAKIIESPENEHWFKLSPGTILFMDNWRLLHGRSSFTGHRHMCGTYVPREVWTGKTKLMGLS